MKTTAATIPAPAPVARRPERSLRALEGLRRGIRRAFLIDGIVVMALWAVALAPAAFLLDWLLVLPRAPRAVILLAGTAYLLWLLGRRVLLPRRVPLGDEDLAVLVENRSPDLAQALITAVELSRPGHGGAPHLSGDLIDAVVQKVEQGIAALPRSVVDLRPVLRNAGLLALVVILTLGGTAARPDLAGIFLRRFFLMADLNWPRRTQLELVTPRENPVLLAVGDDLPVEVRALRGAPNRVEVEARGEGGRWRDPMVEGAGGLFRKVFENVGQSFRFRVQGGDDALEEVQVLVRIQPSLARLDAWFLYPDYTGLDPTGADRPVSNPTIISLPKGTRVALRGWCDLPLGEAFLAFKPREDPEAGPAAGDGGAPGMTPGAGDSPAPSAARKPQQAPAGPEAWPDPAAQKMEVLPAAPRPAPFDPAGEPQAGPPKAQSTFDAEITVQMDGQCLLQLRSTEGFAGRKGKTVSIRALPERTPVVKIVEPGRASEEVSPEAKVPLQISVRHIYGIRSASIEGMLIATESSDTGKVVSFPLGETAPGPRAAPLELGPSLVLDMAKEFPGIAPGARFQFFAQADDFGGHVGRSESYVLHILSKEDIQRILNDRLMLLRDQLREAAREEESARKDLQGFQDELVRSAQGSGLDAKAAVRLVRNRQDQERVTARLERLVKEFDQILWKMESNRVGEEKEKTWIGGLRTETADFALKRSPSIQKAIEELRAAALAASQAPDRLGGILDDQRRLERDIQMLASQISEVGDINWVIQQLQEIRRRQEEVRDQTKSRARGGSGAESLEGPKEPGAGKREESQ